MLQQGCDDEDSDVRSNTLWVIVSFVEAAPHLAGDLLAMLQKGYSDKDSYVRSIAIKYIVDSAMRAPHLVDDLLPLLQKGCSDEDSAVRSSAMKAIGSIAKAASHRTGDLLPLLQKGCDDEDSDVHEEAKKTLHGINVDKNMLSTVLSTPACEKGCWLLLIRNAITLDCPSESEEAFLVFHTTSSKKIIQWDKKDLHRFVRRLKEDFDENFPGLLVYLNKRLT